MSLVDLFRIRAALAEREVVGDGLEDAADDDDEGEEAHEEDGPVEANVLDELASEGCQICIENPATAYLWNKCLQGLHRIAASASEADPILIQPGLESRLREPCSRADRARFKLPLAQMWDELADARLMLRTIARLFKRVLALPASEAHCERVIAALRKMVCPFGFRLCEDTIRARLAAPKEQ